MAKSKSVLVRCPTCIGRRRGTPLPIGRVSQGRYGNCAVCYRQLRPVRKGGDKCPF